MVQKQRCPETDRLVAEAIRLGKVKKIVHLGPIKREKRERELDSRYALSRRFKGY